MADTVSSDEPSSTQSRDHNVEDEAAVSSPSTFKGQLNLSGFAFSPSKTAESSPKTRGRPRASHQGSSSSPVSFNKRKSGAVGSTSSSPSKRVRVPASYAPPSTYAHLSELPDSIEPNLILVFIGLNPGVETARSGNPYAHPSNLFWKLLYSSGITPRRYLPSEHRKLLDELALGNTNIVSRPTKNGAELSKKEMDESVASLEEKIAKSKPDAVCVVGKSIWESVWRVRHGKAMKKLDFKYGWQDQKENMGKMMGEEKWDGSRVFVATSTSGLAASMSLAEKEAIWAELGTWVKEKRSQRATGVAAHEPIE